MNRIKTNSLRIEASTPEQVSFMLINGIKLMKKKLKSEGKSIEKVMLSFHFNLRDASITDEIGTVYKRLIEMTEEILGFDAEQIFFTANDDWENTYTMDILLILQ